MPAAGKRGREDTQDNNVACPVVSILAAGKRWREAAQDDASLLASAGCASLEADWQRVLLPVLRSREWAGLAAFVSSARARGAVYPPASDTFSALRYCSLSAVKVVIVGQDPYHGAGQAHGLAFSVPPGVAVPPSLRNILKEVADDVGAPADVRGSAAAGGSLAGWARQGVLLLNTVLTVAGGAAGSHAGHGWEAVTAAILAAVIARKEVPCAFLLWGKPAQAAVAGLGLDIAGCVLEAPHPSPLSSYRGFFGCKHFSQANAYLARAGAAPVRWHERA